MTNIKAVIFAGGQGTRLWPISRKNTPKQFKPFLDGDTLMQKTYSRLSAFLKPENIYLCTPHDLKHEMCAQVAVDGEHLILEPMRRDTAPAIGLATLRIFLKDPQAVVCNVWADQYILHEDKYRDAFATAEEFLRRHPQRIFMVGVKPRYPETGYGYIKMGELFDRIAEQEIFHVDSFKEKPDAKTAEEYVSRSEYLWNPAMFFFRADHLMNLFAKHAPEIHGALMRIKDAMGTSREEEIIAEEFAKMPKVAFDYAIIEKERDMNVISADLGWTDVGHWKAIYDILTAGKLGHAVKGAHYVEIDSSNNLIFSETGQMISTIGVHDSLVIVSKDAILICEKSRAQDVKKIVEQLASRDLEHLL